MPYQPWKTYRDKKAKQFPRRKYTLPQPPKECDIVEVGDRSRVHFFSVKAAKRALAGLIAMLPARKSKDEPKRFTIVK